MGQQDHQPRMRCFNTFLRLCAGQIAQRLVPFAERRGIRRGRQQYFDEPLLLAAVHIMQIGYAGSAALFG